MFGLWSESIFTAYAIRRFLSEILLRIEGISCSLRASNYVRINRYLLGWKIRCDARENTLGQIEHMPRRKAFGYVEIKEFRVQAWCQIQRNESIGFSSKPEFFDKQPLFVKQKDSLINRLSFFIPNY